MAVELTRLDQFIDYLGTKPPAVQTHEVREDLMRQGFFTEKEIAHGVNKHLDKVVRDFMRQAKYDQDGNPIERFHVMRGQGKDKQPFYVQGTFATYEDAVFVEREIAAKVRYFQSELDRVHALFMGNLSGNERRKLGRVYQKLLEFGNEPELAEG